MICFALCITCKDIAQRGLCSPKVLEIYTACRSVVHMVFATIIVECLTKATGDFCTCIAAYGNLWPAHHVLTEIEDSCLTFMQHKSLLAV